MAGNSKANRAQTPSPESEGARERILDAAHKMVGEHGPHGASIREIAKASDANLALIYYYFKSKEGLLHAVVLRNAEMVGGFLQKAAAAQGSPRQKILAFGQAWMEIAFQKKKFMASWFRQTIQDPGPVGEALRERVSGNIGLLAAILEEGADRGVLRTPPGGFRLVAMCLMTSLVGVAMEMPLPHRMVGLDLSEAGSRRKYLESVVDLFLSGLEIPAGS